MITQDELKARILKRMSEEEFEYRLAKAVNAMAENTETYSQYLKETNPAIKEAMLSVLDLYRKWAVYDVMFLMEHWEA